MHQKQWLEFSSDWKNYIIFNWTFWGRGGGVLKMPSGRFPKRSICAWPLMQAAGYVLWLRAVGLY